METFSFARTVLEKWGFAVEKIPESEIEGQKEADFLATYQGIRFLIEEKAKHENPELTEARAESYERGEVHIDSLPSIRNETVSGVLNRAAKQIVSSARLAHDIRLVWFTATGPTARGKFEQFRATIYGLTNAFELGASSYRRCYFYRRADFVKHAAVLDGAIGAFVEGQKLTPWLFLNPLSKNLEALRNSSALAHFGGQIEDPLKLEEAGTAFIIGSDLRPDQDRISYLQEKYQTGQLNTIDVGFQQFTSKVG